MANALALESSGTSESSARKKIGPFLQVICEGIARGEESFRELQLCLRSSRESFLRLHLGDDAESLASGRGTSSAPEPTKMRTNLCLIDEILAMEKVHDLDSRVLHGLKPPTDSLIGSQVGSRFELLS